VQLRVERYARRLAFPMRAGRSDEKLGGINFQHIGKFPNDFQADVGHGAFNSADVSSIDAGLICQILLGNTPVVPDAAQVGCESMAEVHASANRYVAY
jgi:hypothetical protein